MSEITFRPFRSVPMTAGLKSAGRFALVDEADYELVSGYRWRIHEYTRPSGRVVGPYAIATIGRGEIGMHALITGYPLTDHINHTTLDNRRDNLRAATDSQSCRNRRGHLGTSSVYKGVFWNRRAGKWQAKIAPGGVQRHLGYHLAEENAARAYDAAAAEAYGEYAYLNFPAERAA